MLQKGRFRLKAGAVGEVNVARENLVPGYFNYSEKSALNLGKVVAIIIELIGGSKMKSSFQLQMPHFAEFLQERGNVFVKIPSRPYAGINRDEPAPCGTSFRRRN
jgi:hypothetical protein